LGWKGKTGPGSNADKIMAADTSFEAAAVLKVSERFEICVNKNTE
jgi:hypothetical protein